MQLGIVFMEELLCENYDVVNKKTVGDDMKFTNVLPMTDETQTKYGTVYVISATDSYTTVHITERCAIISIGRISLTGRANLADYYELSPETSFCRLLGQLLNLFNRYTSWSESLYKDVSMNHTIGQLLDSSMELLGNPIYFHDKFFNLIAWSSNIEQYGLEDMYNCVKKPEIPFEQVSKANKLLHSGPLTKKAVIVGGDKPYMHCNIFVKGNYEGQLFVDARMRDILKTDCAVLEELAGCIEIICEKRNLLSHSKRACFEQILCAFIDRQEPDIPYFEETLSKHKWNRFGDYYCMILKSSVRDNTYLVNRQCDFIDDYLPDSCCFICHNSIVCIVSANVFKSNSLANGLEELMKQLELIAGISQLFHDLTDIRTYYLQAINALAIGREYDPNEPLYPFGNYIFHYILRNCAKDFSADYLIPTELKKLLKYDAENNTNYAEALKSYLQNDLSPTKTIKKMYIHKSTFVYKLNKINELIDIDYDNPDDKLRFLLAFKYLELTR